MGKFVTYGATETLDNDQKFIIDSDRTGPGSITAKDAASSLLSKWAGFDTFEEAVQNTISNNQEFIDRDAAIPPWARLRTLEEAARNYENDESGLTEKWLEQLVRPGSSLGGARPKATVIDEKGGLWIAKFPSKHDENDSGAWEKVVHDLAGLCGLRVPEARLEKFSRYGSTYLVRRFDRDGMKRIHYASAMTLLGKTDGVSAADGVSYLDIASFIKAYGASPKADLVELWKRIVFNMVVSNTDDHLRNHAFLLTPRGWALSPMFDVNPEPAGSELSLNVDETDNRIQIELAISVAERFGITKKEAENIAQDIRKTVSDRWKYLAKSNGLSRGQIGAMAPAFFTYLVS